MRDIAPAAFCLLVCSCSGAGGGGTDSDTTTFPDITDTGVDMTSDLPGECGNAIGDFSPRWDKTRIVTETDYPYWMVRGGITAGATSFPRDFVDIWSSAGGSAVRTGPVEPGTYDLADWTPGRPQPGDRCGLCIHLYERCPTEALGMCVVVYAATQGVLEIEALALEPGGTFTATLTGAYLQEWDGHEIVAGGRTYCIDRWRIDVTLQEE